MFDLVICNGTLVDGTGAAPRRADIGVRGEEIVDVGNLARAESAERLDAAGRWVCPGFIDAHSHSDTFLLLEPGAPSKIFQGVTTEVVGNCGASAAPLAGEARLPSDWAARTYPRQWATMAEYRGALETVRPAVNTVCLVGHNTLRAGVSGYRHRASTPEEVRALLVRLEDALAGGARGLSFGLLYPPGLSSGLEEVRALARCVAGRAGVVTTHMRSEGSELLEALEETLALAEDTGVALQVSHLKASGRANWHKLEPVLERIERARDRGVDVTADRYPYTAACTDLDVVFPAWAEEGSRDDILARLEDPATRARLREELIGTRDDGYWSTVQVASTMQDGCRGRRLDELGRERGRHPVDLLLDLVAADRLGTSAFFFGMSEENMLRVLQQPYVMLGSDASLRAPTGPLSEDLPHPRAYGSFARFLRWSIDGRTVPVPEAIRKMTALPAERFGLVDRGRVAAGCKADLVVLDPAAVRDRATYAEPHALAEGVEAVIVNGALTLHRGRFTGIRRGRML